MTADAHRLREAEERVRVEPGSSAARMDLGDLHRRMGRLDQAAAAYTAALEIDPGCVKAHLGVAWVRVLEGNHQEAERGYRRVLDLDPRCAAAHHNLGSVLRVLGCTEDAVDHYRQAAALDPDNASAHICLGGALYALEQLREAEASYRRALALRPRDASTLRRLGNVLQFLLRPAEALDCFRQACELDPSQEDAVTGMVTQLQHLCDWDELEQREPRLDALTARALERGAKPREHPFLSVSRRGDPSWCYQVARAWTAHVSRPSAGVDLGFVHRPRGPGGGRLRVGYLSSDLKVHPVGHLTRGLFGRHDRGRFEVFVYSTGEDDGSAVRQHVARSCEHFVDLRRVGTLEAARRVYADRVDVLVELNGHTWGSRLGLLALRPAPIQVTWLGFPGTTGADFIDYLLADRVVAPEAHAPFFSEAVVRLPGCYQFNSLRDLTPAPTPTREEAGLPRGPAPGLVFASFNEAYKIDRAMFVCWMRVLTRVPGSVLWLLVRHAQVAANLRRAASLHGVDPERLVFAPRRPHEQHLARLALADLGLDTRVYGGHTTTSEMLWAGVPVLTARGTHFASLVSQSALAAAGVAEDLVAEDLAAYEDRAVLLATDTGRREALRARIRDARATCSLFDAEGKVRALEAAYLGMWERYAQGLAPQAFEVSTADGRRAPPRCW